MNSKQTRKFQRMVINLVTPILKDLHREITSPEFDRQKVAADLDYAIKSLEKKS